MYFVFLSLFLFFSIRDNLKFKNSIEIGTGLREARTWDEIVTKFQRINEQWKNEPLIKEFLHFSLAFDASYRAARMSTLDTRVSRKRTSSNIPHARSKLQRSFFSRCVSVRPGRTLYSLRCCFLTRVCPPFLYSCVELYIHTRSYRESRRRISRALSGWLLLFFHNFFRTREIHKNNYSNE